MAEPVVRPAVSADIPELMRIRAAVRENRLSDPSRVPPAAVQDFIDRSTIWLWQEDGRVLGFSAADPADGSIWALFVDPAAEGRGIGRRLLDLALDDLRRAGWTQARLTTQPGSRADRFYRRGGWQAGGLTASGERIFTLPLRA